MDPIKATNVDEKGIRTHLPRKPCSWSAIGRAMLDFKVTPKLWGHEIPFVGSWWHLAMTTKPTTATTTTTTKQKWRPQRYRLRRCQRRRWRRWLATFSGGKIDIRSTVKFFVSMKSAQPVKQVKPVQTRICEESKLRVGKWLLVKCFCFNSWLYQVLDFTGLFF